MKKNLLIMVFVLAALSIVVYAATRISIQKTTDCKTVYYDETEDIYEYVTKERPVYGICTAFSEENQTEYEYRCQTGTEEYESYEKTGEQTVQKSKEVCRDMTMDIILDGPTPKNYNLEYGDWGKCTYTSEDTTLIITCDSKLDGNNDGICKPGESCVQFRITTNGVQRFEKNSRYDWVEHDDTFVEERLQMEVVK